MNLPHPTTADKSGLHARYEIAGLILDSLPVPWNADAVIIEANIRPPKGGADKHDFKLHIADSLPATAELIAQRGKHGPIHVFFRVPVPRQSCVARVDWRDHSLGQIELPIITQQEFDQGFALDGPTVHVVLGDRTVACQTFVAAQAKSLLASAVVRSVGPLAPAHTMGLRVEITRSSGAQLGSVAIPLTEAQLRMRQTLVTVQLPKPRSVGQYEISWHLAARCLHRQPITVVSRTTLMRSLRISATRCHVINDDGTTQTLRSLPLRDDQLLLDGIAEVAPIFFVCSGERGMAGLAPFALRALIDDVISTAGIDDNVLVTDGPTPILLGVIKAGALARTKHFTLASGQTILGNLPLLPVPKAEFSAEGGFAPLDDFLWTPAAEEQFNDRLGKLLDGG